MRDLTAIENPACSSEKPEFMALKAGKPF